MASLEEAFQAALPRLRPISRSDSCLEEVRQDTLKRPEATLQATSWTRQAAVERLRIQATLTYKEKQATQTIFVVRNLQHNLVGLPAIRALDILTRINAISKPVKEQFPSLFTGLGTFPGSSYDIQLKPDAKPFAHFTPRNVSLPMRQKVKDKLTQMEALGFNHLVCRHGSCTEEVHSGVYLCRLPCTE